MPTAFSEQTAQNMEDWVRVRLDALIYPNVHVEINRLQHRDALEIVIGDPGPDQVWGNISYENLQRLRARPEPEVMEWFRKYLKVFPTGDLKNGTQDRLHDVAGENRVPAQGEQRQGVQDRRDKRRDRGDRHHPNWGGRRDGGGNGNR